MNVGAAPKANRVVLWDLTKSGPGLRQTNPAGGPSNCVSFAFDGNSIASVNFNKVHIWEIKNGTELTVGPMSQPLGAIAVACSPKAGLVAVGNRRGEVRLLDTATFDVRWTKPAGGVQPIHSIAWSNDARRVVAASDTGSAVLDAADGRLVNRLPLTTVRPIFSPDGRWIAGAGSDHAFRINDVASGRILAASSADDNAAMAAAAFSADGQSVTILGVDGMLRNWSIPVELSTNGK
jgi:WD40 repeat protein